jgi:diguanylate cyclase (GGDEF)-like protein
MLPGTIPMTHRPTPIIALLIALTTSGLGAGWAAATERGRRPMEHFEPTVLNAGAQNWMAVVDQRDIIHLGNRAGVLEFDGEWWRLHPLPNNSAVRALAVDADGRIGVGGHDEFGVLVRGSDGAFAYRSLSSGIESRPESLGDVHQVARLGRGLAWLADAGVFAWAGNGPARRVEIPGDPTDGAFLVDAASGPLLWTSSGAFRIEEHRVVELTTPEALAAAEPAFVIDGPDGDELVLHHRDGFHRWTGGAPIPFPTSTQEWLVAARPTHGCRLADGRIAVASRRAGVALLDPRGALTEVLDRSNGLLVNATDHALAGRDGSLWLVTRFGLTRVDTASAMTLHDERTGLEGFAQALARHDDRLYVGTSVGLFTALRSGTDGAPTEFRPVAGVEESAWSLLARDDALLVGTSTGVFRVRPASVQRIAGTETVVAYLLVPSPFDPDTVWIGASDGLGQLRRDGARWSFRGFVRDAPGNVRSIVEVAPDTVWIGTTFDGALCLQVETGGDGLQARRLHTAGAGEVDLHLAGDTLYLTDGDSVSRIEENRPVRDAALSRITRGQIIYVVAEDREGRLWLNTQPPQAVRQTAPDAWDVDHKITLARPIRDVFFIKPEADGVIWIGFERGLLRIDDAVPPPPTPARALVRRVRTSVDGALHAAPGAVPEVAEAFGRLRFECAGGTQAPVAAFQYRLLPLQESWSRSTPDAFREYTSLSEGRYRFQVRTVGIDGVAGEPAEYVFDVRPPWYRTRTAWYSAVLAVLVVAAGVIRLRILALRRRSELLEERVAEKTRELAATVADLREATQRLERTNDDLESANDQLRQLSERDALTGIPNRRRMEHVLEHEWRRAARSGDRIALAFLDLDHFKILNDTQGHQTGDACLRTIALQLEATLRRAGDLVARYGGEEFVVLMPETGLEGAMHLAETLRSRVEELGIPNPGAPGGVVTASVGVAVVSPSDDVTTEDLIRAADQALYRAKRSGRNQVRAA